MHLTKGSPVFDLVVVDAEEVSSSGVWFEARVSSSDADEWHGGFACRRRYCVQERIVHSPCSCRLVVLLFVSVVVGLLFVSCNFL